MPVQPKATVATNSQLILGFDIGSTGSKVVAIDADSRKEVWEAYINTNGAPVKAAQNLMQQFVDGKVAHVPVVAVGATGSGREIVGSLMATCYSHESVFVLNEIAAHAEGALHFDANVDTIFEIGGQDAKYIRLSRGRVIDAAMNEACSAGTGSFIEEQGRKFSNIENVVKLGEEALAAAGGVSLGQHCSVFMAEIIDEAVASHVPQPSIIAGIYDSIIQNYLNRVKGSRSVGQVIFCQGMPFSSDALAAAVARQTGATVIVPPNPGTVGALGIALLARKELDIDKATPLDVHRFLKAEVTSKDVFICKSVKGCGGAGNKCRIDRITTVVEGVTQKFTWGGGCSLYDKGTGRKKLPDLSPDPFRERAELMQKLRDTYGVKRGAKKIALTDEFALKSLFPFFSAFLHELGFDLMFFSNADHKTLKRGIEDANVPFCAPMQQYHGMVAAMAESDADQTHRRGALGTPVSHRPGQPGHSQAGSGRNPRTDHFSGHQHRQKEF
jgi:predicted CoA-substrate-specific enzyme activase